MLRYCPHVTSKRTRAILDQNEWRWLLSPYGPIGIGVQSWEPDRNYALDNGAYTVFSRGWEFCNDTFQRFIDMRAEGSDWIVVPDIVGNMDTTLEMFEYWQPKLEGLPLMLALQDGMTPENIEHTADKIMGVFLGGTTEYKLDSLSLWGKWAKENKKWFHVARVNSIKRYELCENNGADSMDGSGVARFSADAKRMTQYLLNREKQTSLF